MKIMENLLTRLARYLPNRLYLLYRSWVFGNIKRSHITFPRQIDKTAQVIDSIILGNVSLGPNVRITESRISGTNVIGANSNLYKVSIDGQLTVGRYTAIHGPGTDVRAAVHGVNIGSFSSIARNVCIQEYNHVIDRCTTSFIFVNIFKGTVMEDIISKGPISIGNDVWIGAQSVILPGAKISDGAIIGANSTVVDTIPPYAVAVGNPARVVKHRFSQDIVKRLLDLAWWEWDDDLIRQQHDLFKGPLTIEKVDKAASRLF